MGTRSKKTGVMTFALVGCLILSACGKNEPLAETQQEVTVAGDTSEYATEDSTEVQAATEIDAPSKEEVIAMRETVLEGMSAEEIERLTENIKVANLRMESAYLYEHIFDKLSDHESLYWNYFTQKGEIQIGWSYEGSAVERKAIMADEGISKSEFYEKYGEPVMDYNRFDATNFIDLIADMQKSVHNELLIADLQQLMDLTRLAEETHEMHYVNSIYKILHDLDYYLLRYGVEDVGMYTLDDSIVSEYYGVLAVYGATPILTETENK